MSSAIPDTWLELRLGDVVDYGKTQKIEPDQIEDDFWVLELEDIEKDTSRLLQKLTYAERKSKSTKNRFAKGEVLYGKLRPYLNKVLIADQDGCCTTEVIPLKPNGILDNRYLFYWLKHPTFLEYVADVSHGINMPRLGTDAGKAAPFILAPLNEQKRIADKLDTLLTAVDACRARLDKVPALIKRFRQSVLAAATSGALTEDWRACGELDWKFERAADVCAKVQSGGTPKDGFSSAPGIPFIKVYNIVDQKIDFHYRPQFATSTAHIGALAKSRTYPGDVLMNIVGPPLGKVAIVPDTFDEWNINQAITLFRPSEKVTTGWLYYFLCSGSSIADIIHETKGSAGQTNISLSQCRDFLIPVPSIDEQDEIVRRIESLFVIADKLEAGLALARRRIEQLTPSILVQAFRGELVEQNQNDEPASVLLEKITIKNTSKHTVKKAA